MRLNQIKFLNIVMRNLFVVGYVIHHEMVECVGDLQRKILEDP